MPATTYLSNKLLDHALKNTAYAPAATVYLALFTTATTDAGGGTEVVGGSYARQAVTFGTAATKHTDNTGVITFTNMPTATITHGAIMDASTAGNMLTHGALVATINSTAGQTVTFAIGDIDETLT